MTNKVELSTKTMTWGLVLGVIGIGTLLVLGSFSTNGLIAGLLLLILGTIMFVSSYVWQIAKAGDKELQKWR